MRNPTRPAASATPTTLTAATATAFVAAAGTLLLALGHTGVRVPLLSALGPGGNRAVPQAVIAFLISSAAYLVVGAGLARRRDWAWPAGLVLGGLTIVSGIGQYRGTASAIGIALSAVLVLLLLSPATRAALRRR